MSAELRRRHRKTVMVVAAFLVLTLILTAIAFLAVDTIFRPGDERLPMMLRIAILIFGLGAFVLRRTRFAAMRLKNIGALKGAAGLLHTLQSTTIQVACIAGAIALMGFIITIRSGDAFDMLRAAGVAIIVLIYCYPSLRAWERVLQGMAPPGDADSVRR